MKNFFVLIAVQSFFYLGMAQNVTKTFRNTKVSDDFNQVQNNWVQTNTSQNVFLQTANGYDVFRKSENNGFVLLPKEEETYDFFDAAVQFTFNSGQGKKQSAGLVMQAQAGGNGALIIEINRKKQYRVRRAQNNRYVNITEGTDGWVKSKKIKSTSEFTLRIATNDRIYDIYINDEFIQSFTETELTNGQIGLYIGAASQAVFKKLVIKSDDEDDQFFNTGPALTQEQIFTETIVKLRESIQKKDQLIAKLESELRGKTNNTDSDSATKAELEMLRKNVRMQAITIADLEDQNTNLNEQVSNLQLFKSQVKENENGDIIINLTKLTSSQKQEIENNNATIHMLNLSMEKLKQENQELNKRMTTMDLQLNRDLSMLNQYEDQFRQKDSAIVELEYQVYTCKKNGGLPVDEPKPKKKKKDKKAKEMEETPEFEVEPEQD